MAATLTSTGFQDALDYKIIQCTGVEDATVQTNVAASSGTLYGVIVDSSNTTDNVFVHIYDGKDTAVSEIIFRGKTLETKSLQIPTGYAFDELNFRVSAVNTETDTTDFSGTVDVTLVCSMRARTLTLVNVKDV
tara:strand:+ start:2770 stop:3171 length:402 start_codon:yes stop_codon:yes gene_type:complete